MGRVCVRGGWGWCFVYKVDVFMGATFGHIFILQVVERVNAYDQYGERDSE